MRSLFGLLGAVWIALGIVAHNVPTIAGTLIGAGVGATVSVALYAATRAQARRQTTLDLFKEYYSADFAIQRRACERFMARHEGVDWSRNDPYVLGRDDEDLGGYGAVVRYWQRVATLYREGEVARGLTQRLLARELGFWNVRVFRVMDGRQGMYVLDTIADLARRIWIGEARTAFEDGERAGRRKVLPEVENSGTE